MTSCIALDMPAVLGPSKDTAAVLDAVFSRKRIVVAEDNDDFRCLLREAFEDAGYKVTECRDGKQLYKELTHGDNSDVAAVVSDHRMPRLLGLEVLERLRANRPKAPFVLITAFGDHAVHKRAKDLGADLVVNKPLDEEELVRSVQALLGET